MKLIKNITAENFEPYGTVMEFAKGDKEAFRIIDWEEKKPWRLAVFRYSNKSIRQIECHPESKESFEPLKGITLLLTAVQERPEEYEVFLLDKPVCLRKNIWHQVLSLSEEAQVKITENLHVESKFYDLPVELAAFVGLKTTTNINQ